MADFGSAWGWQIDRYADGTADEFCIAGFGQNEIDNDVETATISPILAKAIDKWQNYFEQYAYDDYCARKNKDFSNAKFDWDNWNKAGIRLAHLLKLQIGHLFDEFYYTPAFEDKDCMKVYQYVAIQIK
jgi:hypothetical protein